MFRPVPGYEALYLIDNTGAVKTVAGKSRRPYPSRTGYLQILLSKNAKKACFLVHRLVAMTFIRPLEPKEVINHLNGKILDNRVENLEITNHSGNVLHAYRVLQSIPLRRGAGRSWTKLTEEQVLEIRRLAGTITQKEIALRFGIDQGHVSAIVNRKKWDYLVSS